MHRWRKVHIKPSQYKSVLMKGLEQGGQTYGLQARTSPPWDPIWDEFAKCVKETSVGGTVLCTTFNLCLFRNFIHLVGSLNIFMLLFLWSGPVCGLTPLV